MNNLLYKSFSRTRDVHKEYFEYLLFALEQAVGLLQLQLIRLYYFWYKLLYGLPYLLSCRAMKAQVIYRYPFLVLKYMNSSWIYTLYMVGISLDWMLLFGLLFETSKRWDIHFRFYV